jgi:hypothetical protein
MIRHVVLFRWTGEATEEQKQRVAAEIARLPSLVPSLRAFHIGSDLGINPGNFDFAVAADFDDIDGYLAYRDHPEHRAMISQFIQPVAAQRAAVQYDFLGGTGSGVKAVSGRSIRSSVVSSPMACSELPASEVIVDLASVADLDDEHHQFAVAHFVHDAVVANADTQPAMLASQCLDAGWPGLGAQGFGGALDTTRYLAVKLAKLSQRCRAESQLVARILAHPGSLDQHFIERRVVTLRELVDVLLAEPIDSAPGFGRK